MVEHNALYYGDCLDWMRKWPDDLVDLIYLDPPFNSDDEYNMLFPNAANLDINQGGGNCTISRL